MQNDYSDISAEVESDFLSCQVCLEHFTEVDERSPRFSPCGHTLCLTCISLILATPDPKCPFCKHWYPETATLHTFPKNFMLLGFMSYFPKTRGSLNLLEYSCREKECVEEEAVAVNQDVDYYDHLIQQQEQRLTELHEKKKEAIERREHYVKHLEGLSDNINRLTARVDASYENTPHSAAQLQSHLVPPPPPPRESPHPLLQLGDPSANRRLRRVDNVRNLLSDNMQDFLLQQQNRNNSGGNEWSRLSVTDELHSRLMDRANGRQLRSRSSTHFNRYQRVDDPEEISELQRVFMRRRQGLGVTDATSALI